MRIDELLYLRPEPKEETAQKTPDPAINLTDGERKKLLEDDEMIGNL